MTGEGETAGRRVLIVPEDLLAEELDETFLSRATFQVRRAADAAGALALVETFRPHLVLFGSGLWDIAPSAFCRELRARSEGLRLVMISDQVLGSWEDALEADTDGHFASPIDRASLLEALALLLDVRRRRSKRVKTELLARAEGLSAVEGAESQLVNLISISEVGCVAEASEELRLGAEGRLLLRLPATGQLLRLGCTVRLVLDEIQLHYVVELTEPSEELRAFVSEEGGG